MVLTSNVFLANYKSSVFQEMRILLIVKKVRKYNDNAILYEEAKEKYFLAIDPENKGPSLDIWNGDGNNKNAMLTIFRHFDNSTVVKGWQGQYPKTYWVLNYPLFEKIHYLLVVDFNVFGVMLLTSYLQECIWIFLGLKGRVTLDLCFLLKIGKQIENTGTKAI